MSITPASETARLLFERIERVARDAGMDLPNKISAYEQLLTQIFVEETKRERLQFSTIFSRIAYAGHKFQLKKQTLFWVHAFRKAQGKPAADNLRTTFLLGISALSHLVSEIYEADIPPKLQQLLPPKGFYQTGEVAVSSFEESVRCVLLEDEPASKRFVAYQEASPLEVIHVGYDITAYNELFNPSIADIRKVFGFPLMVNLLDVEIDENGLYRPRAFVIEPDFLVDVSAISECFQGRGVMLPAMYLLKKFLPFESTPALMLGNIANHFLDELMTEPETVFQAAFKQTFAIKPLAFSLFDDKTVRELYQNSQKHFLSIKQLAQGGFQSNGIHPEHCYLEPTFYSNKYGLQGRLDIFHCPPDDGKAAIIELKSGKPFNTNQFGINAPHYIQTLLYDLLVKSVFKNNVSPTNYMLYSSLDTDNLKFAPVTKAQQFEALLVRNRLIAYERGLQGIAADNTEAPCLLDGLTAQKFKHASSFVQRDVSTFEKTYQGMDALCRTYFKAFVGFVAREHQLAKIGLPNVENTNGLAALWLSSFVEKQENFDILAYVQLEREAAKGDPPLLFFSKTERTNALANFRQGDIVVLYNIENEQQTALDGQIFKCTIVELSDEAVHLQLRSKQFNTSAFRKGSLWHLEHDLLDSSFNGMYRSLFAFAGSPRPKRDLMLTTREPDRPVEVPEVEIAEMTAEQESVFAKMLAAKDYFLLWGPPGTGKTSVMLKHFVGHLFEKSEENILLLAYTNRAVDEICEAIESYSPEMRHAYLRIGSRTATHPKFHARLFDQLAASAESRQELKNTIEGHRIFVATVASMSNRMELLQLKHFHTVAIDEASQIPEPMLVGLLPCFDRFVLIGDHKQLPAVVVQDAEKTMVENEALLDIGLTNLRDSLFERLYRRCIAKDWAWAFARLSHQGRMHQDIMAFPNGQFYEGHLKILPPPHSTHQMAAPSLLPPESASKLERLLCERRVLFLPSPADGQSGNTKTNVHEAKRIAELVAAFVRIRQSNGLALGTDTIGVITPYRAQIACIRNELSGQRIENELTIDTVERYQGGARDIILISLCTNNLGQIQQLVSLSEDGEVDRKLNVALTRARQHLVVVGNPQLLRAYPIYRKFVEAFGTVEV